MKAADQKAHESARLVSGPTATKYLGGERPERFGVKPIQGKRQRLYDQRAIDAALDRISGIASGDSGPSDNLDGLIEEWC